MSKEIYDVKRKLDEAIAQLCDLSYKIRSHSPFGLCDRYFAMLLHSKIRSKPFPRPCEATGNDAPKNFVRRHLHSFVVRCSCMKYFAHFQRNTP